MAGHSQFKNIMRRKGAQDAKKAKVLSKVTREIIAACKTGMPDPAANPRLRAAIQWAREENMPRDKIDAAIKRGAGNTDTDNYDPIRYEGYGPGGTAIIVQALTNNRNRTASEVRSLFTKYGGNLGETGSVSFMFDYVGVIVLPARVATEDSIMEAALEAGADNVESDSAHHIITCSLEQFISARDYLEKRYGAPESAKMMWKPKNTVPVNSEEHAKNLLKLIDALEDDDDVQEVFSNFEIAETMITALAS